MITPGLSYLIVQYNDTTLLMYNLLSTPYANLNDGISGYIQYEYLVYQCKDDINPPSTNDSILLISCANYTDLVTTVVKANSLGYKGILTYSSYNSSQLAVTDEIRKTGFPYAFIEAEKDLSILRSIEKTNTSVTISGSIEVGLFVIGFSFILALFCCICSCCLCCFICCRCCFNRHEDRDEFEQNRTRQELIESILNRLQQLEGSTQVPLGVDGSKNFPIRTYSENESLETCAVCVEDFKTDENVRVLPCQHIFHPKCIDIWLDEYSSLCPLCKYDMRENQPEGQSNVGIFAAQLQNYGATTIR